MLLFGKRRLRGKGINFTGENFMEQLTESQIDLFAENLPSIEQIKELSDFVHSSEARVLAFAEKVEENMSKPSQNLPTGIGLYILGRNEDALDKLGKAKDCKEKFICTACALRRTGNFDGAIDNFQKGLDYGADALTISLEKVATYRCADNLEAAAKELKKNSNFENVSAEYHYQLARLHEVQGLYEQSVENYKTALELSPEHHRALFHLAYRCDLAGDEEAAIDYYKQITSTSPVYVSALINMAVLYEDAGEFDKASRCIDTVLQYHPNHQRATLFKKDIEGSKTMYYDEEKEKKKTRRSQILETPITDFELSVRSRNCLKEMNIKKIGDLLKISEAELLSYKNFGETSLKEIKNILSLKGLNLGMALEEQEIEAEQAAEEIEAENEGILNKPVENLQLSVRARKCLLKLNIRSIGDLTRKTEAELLGVKNFGVTSLNEIKKSLSNLGLSLRKLD